MARLRRWHSLSKGQADTVIRSLCDGLEILQGTTEIVEREFESLDGLNENRLRLTPGGNYALNAGYQKAGQAMNDIDAALLRMEDWSLPRPHRKATFFQIVARYSPTSW